MIRSFEWRDLPTLHRYRKQGLFLDSALFTTRGAALVPGVLLSLLTPATGLFTWVCMNSNDSDQVILGQITHISGTSQARISFLAPEQGLDSANTLELLEHLARQTGTRGAFHLVGEIDEGSMAFEFLRNAGFVTYARQLIWRMPDIKSGNRTPTGWKTITERDRFAVQTMYNNLVSGLVQHVEPLSTDNLQGLVYYQDGDLVGYLEIKSGHHGIWAQPFIHPDVDNIVDCLSNMINSIPNPRTRPVYLSVRSSQAWLESTLEDLRAEPGPPQAVMVKHLAAHQKRIRPFALPNLEGRPEISSPITQSKRNS